MLREYSSLAINNAIPVSIWLYVLEYIQVHMPEEGMVNTANYVLDLSRRDAHFGQNNLTLSYYETNAKFISVYGRYQRSFEWKLGNDYAQIFLPWSLS